jgi:alcohol dehydrogenase
MGKVTSGSRKYPILKFRIPEQAANDESLLTRLLPLTDVMGTGYHAAICAASSPYESASPGGTAGSEIRPYLASPPRIALERETTHNMAL